MADLKEAQEYITGVLSESHAGLLSPTVGVICGSGLSGLVNCLEERFTIAYDQIPHFPSTTVPGHTGELVFGKVAKPKTSDDGDGFVKVVLMRGRFHSYEGHDMKTVTLPVKLMRLLGVEFIVVTNAAGGINRGFQVGDVMVMSDHIGLPLMAGRHPLVGPHDDSFGAPRFQPMSDAYDAALRQLVWETAKDLKMESFVKKSGCYCMVSGPNYETGAESRMIMRMGADAVGMSTVPEVTVARHCGMRVIGLSLITNQARLPGDSGPVASHEEVLETVTMRGDQVQDLVRNVIGKLDKATFALLEPELLKSSTLTQSNAQVGDGDLHERIRNLDLNALTPIEAYQELQRLKEMV